MKWKTPKAGPLRLSLSAMQVGNICGIDFMAHGPQVCHCEEAVGRRGNFGKALPIGTDHHQNATRRLRLPMALIERPVQGHSNEEGTGAPRHHPDVSLRGAKRRGNLVQAVTISSIVSHDSTGCCEITASLLGPCNDKSDGLSHRICTAKNLRLPLQRAYCPFPERSFSLRACFRCSFLSLLFRFRMAARSGGTIRSGNAAPQRIKSNIKHIPVRSLKGAIPADSG